MLQNCQQEQPLTAFVLPETGASKTLNTADSEAEIQEVRCCVLFFSRPGPLEGVRSKGKRFLFLEAT